MILNFFKINNPLILNRRFKDLNKKMKIQGLDNISNKKN